MTGRKALVWGATLLLPLLSLAAAADKTPGQAFKEAEGLFLQGRWTRALQILENPEQGDSAAAGALRARILSALGQNEEAEKEARRALTRLQSGSAGGLGAAERVLQGSLLLILGNASEALGNFNAALDLDKKSLDALEGRARAWRELSKPAEAVKDLDQLLAGRPKTVVWLYHRAYARRNLGQWQASLGDMTQVLRLNRDFYPAYGLLGEVLALQGDRKRAAQSFDKALEINPGYSFAYLGRAALKLASGGEEAAFKDFALAARADPKGYAPYYNRGEAYWGRANKKEALQDYRKALEAPGIEAQAAAAIGDRLSELKLWEEAAQAYGRALVASATSLKIRTLLGRGRAYASLGREEQALADFNEGIGLDPRNAQLRLARGAFQANAGKGKEALEDFAAAIEADPKLAEAYARRSAELAASGRDEEALKDIEAAATFMPKNYQYQLALGTLRLKAGQLNKAVEALSAALALDVPAAWILERRASAYARLGNRERALEDLHNALASEPQQASLYESLGRVYLLAYDYDAALRALSQALELEPKRAPAYLARGAALAASGSLKKAVKDFAQAVRLKSASPEALTGLCQGRRMLDESRKAVEDCGRALEIDPSYAPAYLQRALAQLALKRYRETAEDVDSAASLGLKRPEGFLAEAIAHAALRQYRQAHKEYLLALQLNPGARTPEIGFGPAAGRDDDFYRAVWDLERILKADDSNPYVHVLKGDALHNAELYDKAAAEYTRAMDLDPALADAYSGRALCHAALESLDDAQQDVLKAMDLNHDDFQLHVQLANILTLKQAYPQAIAEIRKAISLNPKGSQAFLRAGNIYYFQKDFKRALDNYELAVKYDPDNPVTLNGLGLGYFALRRYPEALESFSRAIAANPNMDRPYRNRGSTWTNMRRFSNAASDFKIAGLVNTDPALAGEYQKLVENSLGMLE